MPATLAHLVTVRSQLVDEVLAYLDALAAHMATLPAYYPAHLRMTETGQTRFDAIRQLVQVVEDRTAFERWLAQERERLRAAGQDAEHLAYAPSRARPETDRPTAADAHDAPNTRHRDHPAPPPPVPWDKHARARFQRAVILGDPGFGKTWLLRWEARHLAREQARQLREHTIGLDHLILPLFARLSEVNRSDEPLENALVARAGAGRAPAFRRFVREKLETDRCVVLLDAWDEVPVEVPPAGQPLRYAAGSRQRLGQRLEAFARQFPQPRLLLTSRIVGYSASPIPDAQELELLAFEIPQLEAFVRGWFDANTATAQQFLALLRQNYQVRGLARIPLMLTLMCRAYQEQQLSFPTRRGALYDCCLRGLLRDWKEGKGHDGSDAYVDAVLELLQAVGYSLFTDGHEQFNESLLRAKMRPWLQRLTREHELHGCSAASLIAELKRDGVLITAGEHRDAPLLFLHRTFHEYLAACDLARRADNEGWSAIAALVDKKAWLPAWQEVIVMLAGKLHDPVPLLDLLSSPKPTVTNPHGDDLFRHRLALAALCLPALSSHRRNAHSDIIDRITTATFSVWLQHKRENTDGTVQHLTRALSGLGQVNGRMDGRPLLEWLNRELYSLAFSRGGYQATGALLVALKHIGSVAAREEILHTLARIPIDGENMSLAVVEVVRSMGSAAATIDILNSLSRMRDRWSFRRGGKAAAWAIAELISAGTTPDDTFFSQRWFYQIAKMLWAGDRFVRRAARAALKVVGSAVPILDQVEKTMLGYDYAPVSGNLTKRLRALLQHEDWEARVAAIEMVIGLIGVPTRADLVERLVHLLHDEDWHVREAAADAVAHMGGVGARPDFVEPLAGLLRDQAVDVRWTAAQGLGALIGATARWDVLERLLCDRDPEVRDAATLAVSNARSAGMSVDSLGRLAALLCDEFQFVRWAAVSAVQFLGRAAGTPEFLDRLAELLRDADADIRRGAAEATGSIGTAAARADILAQLARLLWDQNCYVQEAAVRALGSLGIPSGTSDVLTRLIDLLRDKRSASMRTAVAEAMGGIGDVGASPELLGELVQALRDRLPEVRGAAAHTFERLMTQGFRFFERGSGAWAVRTVAELSQ